MGFGTCRMLFDVSLIHFDVRLLSQLKHILDLADQRAHTSTFECVRLCTEGKIKFFDGNEKYCPKKWLKTGRFGKLSTTNSWKYRVPRFRKLQKALECYNKLNYLEFDTKTYNPPP